ncbi:cysteine desulfurase family protein [Fluviispira multicolorata]|uniref:Aminotransferase class V-fold PLP-dependent enzyme n=1 Tax=Fluviispira multicolorata TaxID=2654512 RepID=A0A833JFI0_9BACT|nr:cysteine desulfurase family protein [Fluviispira multicolorata]KAB8033720.1 aminotransferase class V-fold PLP-dependent enzyme [Fluviispira multicolorata]
MNTIYLDHNATSPPSKEHLSLLFTKISQCSGNPSSPHSVGRSASVAITEARRTIAQALGVDVAEILFVSGGSEADNLGITGVLRQTNIPLKEQHTVSTTIEHPAVREPLEYLNKSEGLNITWVKANEEGFVSLIDILKSINKNTTLITIMAANSEIGSIQSTKKLGDFLHFKRWGVLANPSDKNEFEELGQNLSEEVSNEILKKMHFHVDGVQAFGKLKIEEWFSPGVDSCAISAHKLGALQGIGALFLRRGRKFKPFILGGAQEKNRRAGTENLPGIVSFGLVTQELLSENWWEKIKQMDEFRNYLFQEISKISSVTLNSPQKNVLPNTINFSINEKGLRGEDLLVELDIKGICASSGSACSSGANLPSHVILALGKSIELAKNAVRISLSRNTTKDEIELALKSLRSYLIK